jgi:prevent-host-death family protein
MSKNDADLLTWKFMYITEIGMYNPIMTAISVAEARNHFSDLIARSKSEAVFIERRGERAAVVVSPEQYERMLEALEDAEDAAAFDEAMAEEGPNIPWAQVKADLGWV